MTAENDTPAITYIEPSWFREIKGKTYLLGGRCRSCGKFSFPVKPICPACAHEDQEQVPLSNTGTLHTFALSVMGPKGMDSPFIIGFIDLPEGIKLYSLILADTPYDEHLKTGMAMEMIIDKIKKDDAGNDLYAYKFRPVQ